MQQDRASCSGLPTCIWKGADQYRGWFQSSLLTAVAAKGQGAPYKTVLTHGWVVDGEGKAMHKSLGNGSGPRARSSTNTARTSCACGWPPAITGWMCASRDDIFKQLSQVYLKIRNTARYILGNLDGFDPNNLVPPEQMLPLDRWAITRLNQLMETGQARV